MADKTVMLCCGAGMSTSLLVTKMKEDAKARGLDWDIFALPTGTGQDKLQEVDVCLLGPQMGYVKADFEKIADGHCDVVIIPMKDYGRMNGHAVNDLALEHMK